MTAGDFYLLTRRSSGTAMNPCGENSPPTRCSTSYAPVSDAVGPLSSPVGEPSSRPLTAVPGRGVASALRRRAGGLTASGGSFRPVALGVPLIPLSPWIRVHADDGGTVWLIHVTEPVTETIS
jgi:hypothetical protein